jgi:hypothetical protein
VSDDPHSSHKRALSGSRAPGQGTDKRNKVSFCEPQEVCEIVLNVGPKDVHYQRKGKEGCWMVNQKVKRGAEVNFRELTSEEQEQFKMAKQREIDSYMERAAVDIATKVGVDEERVMGMRWILVWKNEVNQDGEVVGRKPKARLIIKGFQDPDLLKIERDAATLSTIGRNLVFAITSKRRWKMALGDIKTAFSNGDDTEYARQIYGEPPDDVKQYLGMSEKELFRIRKAIYGLLNAPRKWVEKLWKELRNAGWIQSTLEPCVWRLFSENELVGLLGIHVDDIVTSGEGKLYESKINNLRNAFPFGSWKHVGDEKAVFCGCELHQTKDGCLLLGQEQYALGLNEIPLQQDRKRDETSKATEPEKKSMKGLLGAVAWRANQTAPWLSATTSILQGSSQSATVKELLLCNKLCRLQRAKSSVGLHFSSQIKQSVVITFSDASHASRYDGASQGGSVTILADARILNGEKSEFSVLSWHSKRLKRVCRSSTSAEIQACANAYDENEFVRQLLFEFERPQGIQAANSDEAVASILAAVVCDAKNLYDSVTRISSSGLQMEEKRLCLEILSIRERALRTNCPLKWVNSDQQVADDTTKVFEVDKLLNLLHRREVGLVFDGSFTSAKKRRKENAALKKPSEDQNGQWKQEEVLMCDSFNPWIDMLPSTIHTEMPCSAYDQTRPTAGPLRAWCAM